jgi:hypothetical protein
MMMSFDELEAFRKEFKKLAKKYRSLPEDLARFKKILIKNPLGSDHHTAVLTQYQSIKIIKSRFFCRYLRKKSLRIIYAFNHIEQKIEFIETYFKGNKPNEDQARIQNSIHCIFKNK